MELVREKLIDSNVLKKDDDLSIDILKEILNEKFKEINYVDTKENVLPFIKDINSLDLWSADFFIKINKNLRQK